MTVDRGLEDELVGRIAQLGPPHEMRLDRFDHGQHRIDEDADLVKIKAGGQEVSDGTSGDCAELHSGAES